MMNSLSIYDPWEEAHFPLLDSLMDYFPGDNLAIDLYEKDDRLVLKAAVPGMDKDAIDITIQDGFLTITAENKSEMKRHTGSWYLREQRYGRWQRSIRLPEDISIDRTEAVLKDGVLTINMPKLEATKKITHKIKVNLPKIKLPELTKKKKNIKITHHTR